MRKKTGDILYHGLAADIFEDVNSKNASVSEGHWTNEKIYIYDALSDASEKEITMMIEYLYNEGFIQDRRTECEVIRGEDFN